LKVEEALVVGQPLSEKIGDQDDPSKTPLDLSVI
jgi:hypothetical protein